MGATAMYKSSVGQMPVVTRGVAAQSTFSQKTSSKPMIRRAQIQQHAHLGEEAGVNMSLDMNKVLRRTRVEKQYEPRKSKVIGPPGRLVAIHK